MGGSEEEDDRREKIDQVPDTTEYYRSKYSVFAGSTGTEARAHNTPPS